MNEYNFVISDLGIGLEILGFLYMVSYQLNTFWAKSQKITLNPKQYNLVTKEKWFRRGILLVIVGLLLQFSNIQAWVDTLLLNISNL